MALCCYTRRLQPVLMKNRAYSCLITARFWSLQLLRNSVWGPLSDDGICHWSLPINCMVKSCLIHCRRWLESWLVYSWGVCNILLNYITGEPGRYSDCLLVWKVGPIIKHSCRTRTTCLSRLKINYFLQKYRCKLKEHLQWITWNLNTVFCQSVFFTIQRLLASGFLPMHIRHRCRNGPRLIKEFSAFPAEVPTGYLLRCFTSHCLGQGFETCPLINEHPIRARPPSFVPSLSDCTALLEALLVAS